MVTINHVWDETDPKAELEQAWQVPTKPNPSVNPFTRCDMCGRDCRTMAGLVVHVAKYHPTKG